MPPRIAKPIALVLGVLLLVAGAAGWADKAANASAPILPMDFWEDIGHLVVGIGLVLAASKGESTAAFALGTGALLVVGFAGISWYQLGDLSRGWIFNHSMRIDKLSCAIHLGLGLAMGAGAILNTSRRQLFYE